MGGNDGAEAHHQTIALTDFDKPQRSTLYNVSVERTVSDIACRRTVSKERQCRRHGGHTGRPYYRIRTLCSYECDRAIVNSPLAKLKSSTLLSPFFMGKVPRVHIPRFLSQPWRSGRTTPRPDVAPAQPTPSMRAIRLPSTRWRWAFLTGFGLQTVVDVPGARVDCISLIRTIRV